jgi:hypothetical protein
LKYIHGRDECFDIGIRTCCPYLIMSNSLGYLRALKSRGVSVKSHSLIYECFECIVDAVI